MKSGARALLTVLLVVVMAGTALAFAVGVNFSAHKTVCINPIAGSSYQICLQVPPTNVSHVAVTGFRFKKLHPGHIRLKFTNHNTVPVKIQLVLVIKTKAGKIHRYKKTFTLQPGKTFKFNRYLKRSKIRAARLKLTVTDTNGDKATITKGFGKFS